MAYFLTQGRQLPFSVIFQNTVLVFMLKKMLELKKLLYRKAISKTPKIPKNFMKIFIVFGPTEINRQNNVVTKL